VSGAGRRRHPGSGASVPGGKPSFPDLGACGRRQRGSGPSRQSQPVRTPTRPDELRGRVFRARDALSAGLLSRDGLRSRAWVRLYRGVYADSSLTVDHDLRIAGARLLVPAVGVFGGRTAAHLHGAGELVGPTTPVEVVIPPGVSFGPVEGLLIRRSPLTSEEITRRARVACTTALRTAVDIARHEPLVEGVVALDVLLSLRVVAPGELRAAAAIATGRGCRRAREVVGLTDGRSESPQESRLRVVLGRAGLPPVPQVVVRGLDGSVVARVDLGYPRQRVAVEYDGAWHAEPGQFAKDRRRLNRLVAAGWTVVHVTAADLHDPATLTTRVRALLAAREIGE
jgi:hypothetical protein